MKQPEAGSIFKVNIMMNLPVIWKAYGHNFVSQVLIFSGFASCLVGHWFGRKGNTPIFFCWMTADCKYITIWCN